MKYFDPTDDSFIGKLTESELEEVSKEYVKEVKADLLEASTERNTKRKTYVFMAEAHTCLFHV